MCGRKVPVTGKLSFTARFVKKIRVAGKRMKTAQDHLEDARRQAADAVKHSNRAVYLARWSFFFAVIAVLCFILGIVFSGS